MADGRPTDYAALAAVVAVALRSAGLQTGPDRSGRLAGALTVMHATTLAELHACALATMVSGPAQVDVFERVFSELFGPGGPGGPRRPEVVAPQPGMVVDSVERAEAAEGSDPSAAGGEELPEELRGLDQTVAGAEASEASAESDSEPDPDPGRPAVRRVASVTERLRQRDFAQLSPSELAQLATLMRQLVIAVPPRRTRRYRPRKDGARLDMRRTMRQAIRTGGEPIKIARRAVRVRQRRLVVLCDISGSMEPYARAILQLMYVASRSTAASGGGGSGFSGPTTDAARPRTEVFTFATRLTRLTPYLAAATPESMLARAGQAAPDWAGGTRIGAALREFNDRYGTRGMARGAVVLIISDGWETGDPALVGAQMARLHRVAYRIVWANPRTQSDRYRPEVGGMAAAWPYCDAVVSAHNFESLDELLAALRAPRVQRSGFGPALGPLVGPSRRGTELTDRVPSRFRGVRPVPSGHERSMTKSRPPRSRPPAVVHDLPATIGDRRGRGRAARKRAGRRGLGHWDERDRGHDALGTILAQNKIRVPELVPIRHYRMAISPWNYYRGAAAVMAGDLASQPDSGLIVQLCGDAHVLNFGLWATPERNLSFDLRDFDETLPGPFEWDVKRFAASLVVAARENRIRPKVANAAVAAGVEAYCRRIRLYRTMPELDTWYDNMHVDSLISYFEPADRGRVSIHIEKKRKRRTSRGAFAKLTTMVHGRPRITAEPPIRVTIGDDEQDDLTDHLLAEYRLTLQEDRRSLFDRFTVVDVVRQVVGVGSVGMQVYLVLLEGRTGADPLFLQVKQAGPAVYEEHTRRSRHDNHGARVINGKRLIQSATDIFVGWGSLHGKDYYVRQFRDMKIIPSTELIAPRLVEFATACGETLARAHARSGDPVAIDGYIGKGPKFAAELGRFARQYADQNERDHAQLVRAIARGKVESLPDSRPRLVHRPDKRTN